MLYSNQDLIILYNIYANKIRDIYKNSDETITYQYTKYYHTKQTDTIKLSECTGNILCDIMNDNQLNLIDLNIQLNAEEQKQYDAYMNCSLYDHNLACNLFKNKLYLSLNDKNILRNNIINTYYGNMSFFQDTQLMNELQLTIEERNKILPYSFFSSSYNLRDLVTTYYNCLTNEHKTLILQSLLINTYQAQALILLQRVPLEFRIAIFQYVFEGHSETYYELFSQFCDKSIKDTLRDTLFKYVYNNDNTRFDSYWYNYLYKLQDSELQLICEKYYDDIFENKSSFNQYYEYCLLFGNWLRKPERMALIQKLKARTRVIKIPHALQEIKFDQNEVDILNSIILRDKLI